MNSSGIQKPLRLILLVRCVPACAMISGLRSGTGESFEQRGRVRWRSLGIFAREPCSLTRVRLRGRAVSLSEAIQRAAAILDRSKSPLIYGLSRSSTQGQRAAVRLADTAGGDDRYHGLAWPWTIGDGRAGGGRIDLHARRSSQPGRPRHLLGYESCGQSSTALSSGIPSIQSVSSCLAVGRTAPSW